MEEALGVKWTELSSVDSSPSNNEGGLGNVMLTGLACNAVDGSIVVSGWADGEAGTSKGMIFSLESPNSNNGGGGATVQAVVPRRSGSQEDHNKSMLILDKTMGSEIEEAKPKALLYDEEGALFIADAKRKCILSRPQPRGDRNEAEPLVQSLVSEYEGKPLQGPAAMCFDENGTLFFTDSAEVGVFGADKGSVFTVSSEDQMLRPLALKSLNYPSGIACDPTGSLVYVAETSSNRILRFARRANGVYYSSVYHTFTGGFGPTGLVERGGLLYVARADLKGAMPHSKGGCVCVVGADGSLLREVAAPCAEIFAMGLVGGGVLQDGAEEGLELVAIDSGAGKVWKLPLSELDLP